MTREEHERWEDAYAECVRRDFERDMYRRADAEDTEAVKQDEIIEHEGRRFTAEKSILKKGELFLCECCRPPFVLTASVDHTEMNFMVLREIPAESARKTCLKCDEPAEYPSPVCAEHEPTVYGKDPKPQPGEAVRELVAVIQNEGSDGESLAQEARRLEKQITDALRPLLEKAREADVALASSGSHAREHLSKELDTMLTRWEGGGE